jgi:Outer membrane protein beta-barrel family/Carboxypeptidase regulatory-like domain
MFKIFYTLLAVLISTTALAQKTITVTGIVRSDDGKVLPKANVSLYNIGFRDTLKSITNASGAYNFDNVKTTKAVIKISFVGYKTFSDEFDYTTAVDEQINNDIVLTAGNVLETVTLAASKVLIKEDTVSYKVDSTMFRKNDNVEEVLKKLPGVEVDKEGKVTAQGKEVTKVKVNGKEFFGGDVTTATRQLNADMVDRIQIIDDYGDQAAFTGVKSGDPTKTLNIQLKKDKNRGVFGNASAGAGTENRYSSALTLNRFNNEQQISITGGINNVNANTFDFSRLPGGMGAIAGSTMRSFGVGNGGANGIALSKNIGVNYRDQWSKKVSVNGSYSYTTKDNSTINDVFKEAPNATSTDNTQFTKQNSVSNNITDNHRFDFTLDYSIDSFNFIKFQPGFTFRQVNDNYYSISNTYNGKNVALNNANNTDINNSKTPNYTGNLLYNHRFHKKGRSLSLNLAGANNFTNGLDNVNNLTDVYNAGVYSTTLKLLQDVVQDNHNYNYGLTASYNEPLSKTRALEFNYNYNKRFVENDRETFNTAVVPNLLVPNQTNIYDNVYTTNRFGVNFRTNLKKYNYAVGLAVQPSTLESNTYTGTKLQYKQNIVNYFPMLRLAYNFSKSKSFSINYNGSTNQPTFQQSQPIVDNSNSQNIIIGNPDLKPEFSNTLSTRYNNFNPISGNVFFGSLNFTVTKDKIVNNVKTDKLNGIQETRYLNTNGYYNATAFYAISRPLQNRKYVFNVGGNIAYSNYVSYLDSAKNKGTNWVLSQRFAMDYKIKNWLETSGGVVFGLNDVSNSLISSSNSSVKSWSLTQSSRMFFKHDFNFNYDIAKTINQGYTSNVVANPLIINATLEKMFLKSKNASLKLQGYDLLNQNTNFSRSVNSNSVIIDTRTNRLQRYFLLSVVYRFNKFKGASTTGPGIRQEVRMGGGRMGF